MRLKKATHLSEKGIHSAAVGINSIGVLALTLMMLLTAVDVCLRYIFDSPITGAYELNEFLMAVLVGFGLAYTATQDGHINVDVLITRTGARTQSVLKGMTTLLGVGFFTMMTWRCILYAAKMKSGGYESQSLTIPIYPFVYAVAAGCAILVLVLLISLIGRVKDAMKGVRLPGSAMIIGGIILVFLVFASPLLGDAFPWYVDPLVAGFIGIGLLLVLLFSGMPIALAMGLVGFLGLAYINGVKPGLNSMGSTPHSISSTYSMSVVPLFVLMGSLCYHAGLSKELYYAVYRWIGHFPGGLAMATVGACASFAAVSGSSVATTATMGMVSLPEMKRYKYDMGLAAGSIAAGGSIGILIPPSVILVLYGILTEQSIGKLFAAGFIPGVLEALFYMVTIYILCKRNPALGPKGEKSNFRERIGALKSTWGVLALFILVIGGIYMGVFTPTEAAGVGAFGAFLFALGRKRLTWKKFKASLMETSTTTAMVFLILIGAALLGYFLAVTRLPFELSSYASGLEVNRYVILGFIILLYLILGAIMSSLAMIVLTVPIIFPVVEALGFDPIWFGIIIVRVVEMGQITPPVGINVYVLKGVAKELPLGGIFKGVFPFIMADLCHVILLIAVP
ncbi:MAG: TRAP transporter large permease subunit, partial [Deltaproteobacteria bacterium]|nr:TRAP transporter large permease subunit [Deltaproteobacteria bacterium]